MTPYLIALLAFGLGWFIRDWLWRESLPDEENVNIKVVGPYGQACPCLHTEPCRPGCTCINPMSSMGCLRCCSYGSKEQQKARADHLAKHIDWHHGR